MEERQVGVDELEKYWKGIADGTRVERVFATSEMPSWDEICSELHWRLYRINSGSFSRKRQGYCGVYRLIGLETEKPFKPATISRTCGQDVSGTLYLGEAGSLHQRLNQLRRSLRGEKTHDAGRMWRQSAVLNSKFPSSKLRVGIFYTKVRMHAWIEKDLIHAYLNSFGDSPPLNCSY